MHYILNSAVITNPGRYYYQKVSVETAKNYLNSGEFKSTIGYKETALVLSYLTGIQIETKRIPIKMEVKDSALIFRLTTRLDNPFSKGKLGESFLLENSEIGILERLE